MANHDIIVIGASAGGIETLCRLQQQLPADLPAAIFIVQHLSPRSPGMLTGILDRAGPLPVVTAEDAMPFESGRVYVAPPDRHLLIKEGFLRTAMGPRENHLRPAIDPLFRSAAAVYGPRVVGVVLTGSLDDGSAGLLAIRRCNGVTVVQSPADAFNPDMPENALASLNVDYCLPVADMGELLVRLSREPVKARVPVPENILLEIKIAENIMSDIPSENKLGRPVPLICPDCSGPLWEMENDSIGRYRCSVGHAFTRRALLGEQSEMIERTLWEALRLFEEKAKIQTRLARDEANRQRQSLAGLYEQHAALSHQHAEQLRKLLLNINQESMPVPGENIAMAAQEEN
jgi:two-component system chemotaxis response regulator CheB